MLVVATCALAPDAAVHAKEAMHRGDKAVVTWLDENGVKQTARVRGVTYGHYERRYLTVPKDGLGYKDTLVEQKGLPLAGGFVKFTSVDTIELSWETDAATGASQLRIEMVPPNGKRKTARGGELAGAAHPTSPYLAFLVDGAPMKFNLEPMSTAAERSGHPQILSIAFYVLEP